MSAPFALRPPLHRLDPLLLLPLMASLAQRWRRLRLKFRLLLCHVPQGAPKLLVFVQITPEEGMRLLILSVLISLLFLILSLNPMPPPLAAFR